MTTQNESNTKRPTGLNLSLGLMLLVLVSGCGVEKSPMPASAVTDHEAALANAKRFIVGTSQLSGTSVPATGATPSGSSFYSFTMSGAPTGTQTGSSSGAPAGTQTGSSSGAPTGTQTGSSSGAPTGTQTGSSSENDCSEEKNDLEIARRTEKAALALYKELQEQVKLLEGFIQAALKELEGYRHEIFMLECALRIGQDAATTAKIMEDIKKLEDSIKKKQDFINSNMKHINELSEPVEEARAAYYAAREAVIAKYAALSACENGGRP